MRRKGGAAGAPLGGRRPSPGKSTVAVARRVEILRLGARGDGVADVDGASWFIPFVLPGEIVMAAPVGARGEGQHAELRSIERSSADRRAPSCRHFGRCGGCDLQHQALEAYVAFKRDRVASALSHRGFEAIAIDPPQPAIAGRRRRLALAALRTVDGVQVGLHQQGTHRIEKLAECPVAAPPLTRLLAPLAEFLVHWLAPRAKADVLATVTDAGLDLVIDGPPPPNAARVAAGEFMEAAGVARLSWRAGPAAPAETVLELASPQITMGGRAVILPPGGFLQATPEGEAAIVAAVRLGVVGSPGQGGGRSGGRVLDLFAGCGTLSLPLAADGWKVRAVERDQAAISALLKASRTGTHALPIEATVRDLDDRPFAQEELNGYSAVVFDPPRAGAKAQATCLAQSSIPVVVAVSCNPETFARDARILVDGGYRLGKITVVDQFLWSRHVELVAVFSRP